MWPFKSPQPKKNWWDKKYHKEEEVKRARWVFFSSLVVFCVVLGVYLAYHIEKDPEGRSCWNDRAGVVVSVDEEEVEPGDEDAAVGAQEAGADLAEEGAVAGTEEGVAETTEEEVEEAEQGILGEQYLDWLYGALLGVLLYAMSTVAKFYPRIKEEKAYFRGYTMWYVSTIVKAPIFAVVTLWLVTKLNIDLGAQGAEGGGAGITLDFDSLPPIVLWGAAFILGFYARLGREQFDLIAKFLFPKAWTLAEEEFEVVGPADGKVLLKDKYSFKTDPTAEVVWSAYKGTVDPETGIYTAPDAGDHDEAVVRAALKSEPAVSSFVKVQLRAFKITGGTEVEVNGQLALSVTTKLEDVQNATYEWEVNPSTAEGGEEFASDTGKDVTYKAPAQVPKTEGGKVKVTVTVTGQKGGQTVTYTDDHTITITEQGGEV
jgi:hypothetical protein